MSERIPPYNGVYYLPVRPLGTWRDPCPYVVGPASVAEVIPFPKAPRPTARQLILSTVERTVAECASKSLNEVEQQIRGWPLHKRREVRQRVKIELDKDCQPQKPEPK